jgi:hypothetical protein
MFGRAARLTSGEDEVLRNGILYRTYAAALLQHGDEPFVLSFRAEGKTGNPGDDIIAILQRIIRCPS